MPPDCTTSAAPVDTLILPLLPEPYAAASIPKKPVLEMMASCPPSTMILPVPAVMA